MIKEIANKIHETVLQEWQNAGHNLTGAFAKSLRVVPGISTIEGYGEEYGLYLNSGVPASSIRHPYAPARIEGLTKYGQLRLGLNIKEARRFAYAAATLMKRRGMPKNGASHFIEKALDESFKNVNDVIEAYLGDKFKKILE